MIEQQAIVTQISAGQVWIKSSHSGACGGCAQQTACGTATLAKMLPKREFAVDSDLQLQTGDEVVVAVDDAHLLSTSILMYLLPVLVMLTTTGFASLWLPAAIADDWLPLIALISLMLSFWLIHRLQHIVLLHFCFKPQILRKC